MPDTILCRVSLYLFITAFGVGSSIKDIDPVTYIKKGVKELLNYLGKKVKGIIPVEIGPTSLASAFFIASELKLPIVDADFVGGKSAPEIFLETISLFKLNRTPLVLVGTEGNIAIFTKSISFKEEERILRTFSKEKTFVVGYPFSKKTLEKKIETGTVSEALKIGKIINSNNFNDLLKMKN
ncbi:hypothetical protein CVV26_00265 [Candidatus Kuenenbacteria bacterium HGW-Kuenenbacteria-1]|uniref:S-Me-THD N-terminal domain-containing protein n=1 Tax=Candidatus Kuenenbacteria bacterium HGW-Kuenenbacteria-1 TaxID=2013812 RepID=A0A2N1UP76_9BACT|nr:MAG: hypothetical protein CVV26_00265 [Candidatus Kuenenbacteria bacterium HGW-Kuenenbacteria-1]